MSKLFSLIYGAANRESELVPKNDHKDERASAQEKTLFTTEIVPEQDNKLLDEDYKSLSNGRLNTKK